MPDRGGPFDRFDAVAAAFEVQHFLGAHAGEVGDDDQARGLQVSGQVGGLVPAQRRHPWLPGQEPSHGDVEVGWLTDGQVVAVPAEEGFDVVVTDADGAGDEGAGNPRPVLAVGVAWPSPAGGGELVCVAAEPALPAGCRGLRDGGVKAVGFVEPGEDVVGVVGDEPQRPHQHG
jgi:hypothetical protein